jgi:hypothetical protein
METFSGATVWLFLHITWSSIFKKCGSQVLQHICGWCFTKKPFFRTRKMENGFFCAMERKTFFVNTKMHVCVQYGYILTNYAMDVAITPVIWPESQDSS